MFLSKFSVVKICLYKKTVFTLSFVEFIPPSSPDNTCYFTISRIQFIIICIFLPSKISKSFSKSLIFNSNCMVFFYVTFNLFRMFFF